MESQIVYVEETDNELHGRPAAITMRGMAAMPTRFWPLSLKMEPFGLRNYPGVSAEALAAYVKGLWAAFPDFHLELLNAG